MSDPARSTAFSCKETERFTDAYVDGEFGPEDRLELERHLSGCESCAQQVRVQAAWKAAVRTAHKRPELPAGLRDRLVSSLANERMPVPARRWVRVAAPSAVAALSLVAVLGYVSAGRRSSPVAVAAISNYQRDLPVEVKGGADTVRDWFHHKVDFAVRPPNLPQAALVGGRLANLRDRQAANLVYDLGGQRVSVFVFDPAELPVESARHRSLGNHEVYLQGDRGYNVALYRDRGVGYAFAGDIDEDQMVQLVSSAISH